MAIVMQDIISRVEEYLMDFNALSKRPMNLAVFLCVHDSNGLHHHHQLSEHVLCCTLCYIQIAPIGAHRLPL
jgi:hypothetical protein